MSEIPNVPARANSSGAAAICRTLGEALIELSDSELDALPLPEQLRDAVLLARRITEHGGLYRQKQYIGKLMRKIDAEPIRAALDARRERERAEALRFRRVEQWRDRLLNEGRSADRALAGRGARRGCRGGSPHSSSARAWNESRTHRRARRANCSRCCARPSIC